MHLTNFAACNYKNKAAKVQNITFYFNIDKYKYMTVKVKESF